MNALGKSIIVAGLAVGSLALYGHVKNKWINEGVNIGAQQKFSEIHSSILTGHLENLKNRKPNKEMSVTYVLSGIKEKELANVYTDGLAYSAIKIVHAPFVYNLFDYGADGILDQIIVYKNGGKEDIDEAIRGPRTKDQEEEFLLENLLGLGTDGIYVRDNNQNIPSLWSVANQMVSELHKNHTGNRNCACFGSDRISVRRAGELESLVYALQSL